MDDNHAAKGCVAGEGQLAREQCLEGIAQVVTVTLVRSRLSSIRPR
jgi:hypothetical protein